MHMQMNMYMRMYMFHQESSEYEMGPTLWGRYASWRAWQWERKGGGIHTPHEH